MTRAELYEKIFGGTRPLCPSYDCEKCPVAEHCDTSESWWNTEVDKEELPVTLGIHITSMNGSMSKEQKQTICDKYNESDLSALKYIMENNICKTIEQKREVEALIMYGALMYEYNDDSYTEEEYRKRYKALLRPLGIFFNKDDKARVKEE